MNADDRSALAAKRVGRPLATGADPIAGVGIGWIKLPVVSDAHKHQLRCVDIRPCVDLDHPDCVAITRHSPGGQLALMIAHKNGHDLVNALS